MFIDYLHECNRTMIYRWLWIWFQMIIHYIDEQHDDPKRVPLLYRELPTPPGCVCAMRIKRSRPRFSVSPTFRGWTWFNHEQWWYHEPISNGDICRPPNTPNKMMFYPIIVVLEHTLSDFNHFLGVFEGLSLGIASIMRTYIKHPQTRAAQINRSPMKIHVFFLQGGLCNKTKRRELYPDKEVHELQTD